MQTIEARVKQFRTALIADPQRSVLPGIDATLAQLDKYWHRLFADPVVLQTPDGEHTVQPQRTNNILERFFRGLNRACCKRSGNRLTAAVLDNMLPDVPLVANLDNPDYVERLLDGCKDLAQRIAKVTRRTVTASPIQARKPPSGLPRRTRRALRNRSLPLQIAVCILRKKRLIQPNSAAIGREPCEQLRCNPESGRLRRRHARRIASKVVRYSCTAVRDMA